jgi:acyl-CoA hydrolase
MKIKNTEFQSNFVIMPADCNYMYPMVFGGKMLSEMDINAAMAVRRALYGTDCDSAVTVNVSNVNFYIGAIVGDLIYLEGKVIELGNKSITVKVTGWREKHTEERQKICDGEYKFVSRGREIPRPHGLEM